MFNIIFTLFALGICAIHLFKYGIEDKYYMDFLILFIILIIQLIFNLFI